MSQYQIYRVPPEHTGIRRVLTSGCRKAETPAHAAAGLLALIAARTILTGPKDTDVERLICDHGGAGGADTIVWEAAATQLGGWLPIAHPAQWDTHIFESPKFAPDDPEQSVSICPPGHRGNSRCRMAGHRRNSAMIALAPQMLLAMPTAPRGRARELKRSTGTWGCVDAAIRAGVPTFIVWSADPATQPFRLFWADERTQALITEHHLLGARHREELASGVPLADKSIDLTTAANWPPF